MPSLAKEVHVRIALVKHCQAWQKEVHVRIALAKHCQAWQKRSACLYLILSWPLQIILTSFELDLNYFGLFGLDLFDLAKIGQKSLKGPQKSLLNQVLGFQKS